MTFRLHREKKIIFETDESRGATPSPHSTWEKWFQELKTFASAPPSTTPASAPPSTSASASVMPCLIMKWKPETPHCSPDQGFSVYCSPSQGRGSQTERLCSSAGKYILIFHFQSKFCWTCKDWKTGFCSRALSRSPPFMERLCTRICGIWGKSPHLHPPISLLSAHVRESSFP